MNRFYSVRNRNYRAIYIVAANSRRAQEIAHQVRLVRVPQHAWAVDATDECKAVIPELPELLNGPEGWAVQRLGKGGGWEVVPVEEN